MFGLGKRKKRAKQTEPAALESRIPKEEVTPQIMITQRGWIQTAAATHIGTRESQQDAAYVTEAPFGDGIAFGVLCDGMGGLAGGEQAARLTVSYVVRRLSTLDGSQDIPSFLRQTALEANGLLRAENGRTGQDTGTTLVAAVIHRDALHWVSVGDSRIYILREGEMARVTRDHNYALELSERVKAGQMTREEAMAESRRDALISYIGAPVMELVDVNRTEFQLRPGDRVLLCSDGLVKALREKEILEVVLRGGGDTAESARVLTSAAFDATHGGVMDNTTVVLMHFLRVAPNWEADTL